LYAVIASTTGCGALRAPRLTLPAPRVALRLPRTTNQSRTQTGSDA